MFDRLALHLFGQFVLFGNLKVKVGTGSVFQITGSMDGPDVSIKLADSRVLWRVVLKPDIAIGEAYMDGLLEIEEDKLEPFIELLLLNSQHWKNQWAGKISLFLSEKCAFLAHLNRINASRRNVAHHYDLTDALFDNFLDPMRQYSCAYFETPEASIASAQKTKIARLAAKLNLQKGDRVLDIGCGWGGLATALSKCRDDVHITGITLSESQQSYAANNAKKDGLDHKLNFVLRDYRQQTGQFDKIISVGMLEHVGPANFHTYFRQIKKFASQKRSSRYP